MQYEDRAQRQFVAAVVVAAVLLLVCITLLARTTPTESGARVTTIALIVCGTIMVATAVHRVRAAEGRRKNAWFVLSFGAAFAVVANVWALITDLSTLPDEWYLFGSPVLITALGFCTVGLVMFSPARRRRADVARTLLDGLVIGGSVLFVTSVTVFPQLLAASVDQSLVGRAQNLFLPVMDVLIATLATLLITRSERSSRVPLVLIGAGFCLYTVSDLSYAVLSATQPLALGTIGDVGWIAGYLLFAVAAWHPTAGSNPDAEQQQPSAVLSTVVLFAIFVGATVVSLVPLSRAGLPLVAAVIWVGVILAVVGRQVVLVADNERLRRNLEGLVTERTRELRGITKQQELLLTSVGDGIYGVDRRGLITFVNAATAAILRRPAAELIDQDAHELFHAPQDDGTPYPLDGCYVTEAIRSGITASAEEDLYVRGDGLQIAVEATASPLSGDDGISGAVVVFRDVSERREVDRMKSEFVSIVSHELRTPLTSIRGSLGLVAGGAFGPLPAQAGRMLDIALAGSDRLTRLINDILDIERIESGTLPMSVESCGVRSMCDEAMAMVSGLTVEVPIRLGRCVGDVHTDRDRIVQTLINLLGNAVKFSDPGSEVLLEAVPQGDIVEFTVTDRGRGIPADKLDAIFSRFTQVDSTDAREKGGTGLGLAISRTIIERLGGQIWAESVLGSGSMFRFTLPVASAARTAPQYPVGPEALDPVDRQHSAGEVMVVEDDDALARVLQTLLERSGLSVSRARGQSEALRLLADHRPQVLVLDLSLPDGSGFDVVDHLRTVGRLADLPLVVYSAADVSVDDRSRLTLGETVFLTKGRASPQQLERRVLELLDRVTGRLIEVDVVAATPAWAAVPARSGPSEVQ